MISPGVLLSNQEIQSALVLALKHKEEVQCLFNQGKYVYQSNLIAHDVDSLYFNFDGMEESTLASVIDFYSPVVFVFFNEGLRFQFLAKNSQLIHYNGQVALKVSSPRSINVVEGRRTPRIEFAEQLAHFSTNLSAAGEINLSIREMSMGGFSMWSANSHGLTPHASLRICKISFNDFSFNCAIEVVRINYSLGNPPEKSHIISCRFTQISERDALGLQKKLVLIKEQLDQ